MGKCRLCGKSSNLISSAVSLCIECIRNKWSKSYPIVREKHVNARFRHKLPIEPPRDPSGVKCNICGNSCQIPEGGMGYCGLTININGRIVYKTGSPLKATGMYYFDPHPTNCVADWVCPGATGAGYPKYSLSREGPERGYYNIAVFYGACNLNCLFCQNWEYRDMASKGYPVMEVKDLVKAVSPKTTCVCFFGGDPGPQIIHALAASRAMIRKAREIGLKVFRVCWETNGLMNPDLLEQAIKLSLETGGIIKVDLKAWSPEVYYALTGNDGRLVIKNIERIAKYIDIRKEPPLLVVSTLLVPGYIDDHEIDGITRFLADLDRDIPFRLLAFHPDYLMLDLPPTSRSHALRAYEIAKKNGLRNVSIGNWWLLGDYY